MLYCYNFYTCYLFGNSRYNLACRLKRNNLLGNGILLFWYWDLKHFRKWKLNVSSSGVPDSSVFTQKIETCVVLAQKPYRITVQTKIQNSWIEYFAAKRRFATVQHFQFITMHQCEDNNWNEILNVVTGVWFHLGHVTLLWWWGLSRSRWSKELCQLQHAFGRFNRIGLV